MLLSEMHFITISKTDILKMFPGTLECSFTVSKYFIHKLFPAHDVR